MFEGAVSRWEGAGCVLVTQHQTEQTWDKPEQNWDCPVWMRVLTLFPFSRDWGYRPMVSSVKNHCFL